MKNAGGESQPVYILVAMFTSSCRPGGFKPPAFFMLDVLAKGLGRGKFLRNTSRHRGGRGASTASQLIHDTRITPQKRALERSVRLSSREH
jgi:hypothetical protein